MSTANPLSSSLTDMMTSLMVIFILLLVNYLHDEQNKGQAVVDEVEVLVQKISDKLKVVPGKINVQKDPKDRLSLLIIIPPTEKDELFRNNDDIPTPFFQETLKDFAPLLASFTTAPENIGKLQSIIIEGHTDTRPRLDAYGKLIPLGNLALGQQRALQVLQLVFGHFSELQRPILLPLISATGQGDAECPKTCVAPDLCTKVVSKQEHEKNLKSCRKVVFKLRLKSVQERELQTQMPITQPTPTA